MNLELASRIRAAINDTVSHLRPAPGFPEPTRTALQAHLEALLKEELRALTVQALEGYFAGKPKGVSPERQAFADAFVACAADAMGRTYIDPRKDPEPPIYESLWLQATSDLNAAMALVQQNQEFFGAHCGDDKIKVIGEFFVKWAATMMKPQAAMMKPQAAMMKPQAATAPWYPDDSGDWVEGHPRDLPPGTVMAGWLLWSEREGKNYTIPDSGWTAKELKNPNIVAYKVVKP